jgi:hypothetical protein
VSLEVMRSAPDLDKTCAALVLITLSRAINKNSTRVQADQELNTLRELFMTNLDSKGPGTVPMP